MHKQTRLGYLATLTATMVILAACGGDKPETLLASAKQSIEKEDYKTAVIQIKNALQQTPESAEGRYLLGKALLSGGTPKLSELELRKAESLGYNKGAVSAKLATALVAQGEFKKATDEYAVVEPESARDRAELQFALSVAYRALGKTELSSKTLNAALESDKQFLPARSAKIRDLAAAKNMPEAVRLADQLVAEHPDKADIWLLKGDLLAIGQGKADEGVSAYKKAIELKPDALIPRFRLSAMALQKSDIPAAEAQIKELQKLAPNSPETRLQQVQLALLQKDMTAARAHAQQLVKLAPENPKALQLAGLVELQMNSLTQAEAYLKKAVQKEPEAIASRRALTEVYMRSGQANMAVSTLDATPKTKGELPQEMWQLAGQVYLMSGKPKIAEEYFKKAVSLEPADARRRTSLAVSHLAQGEISTGIDELENIASSDKAAVADFALINAHVRRQDYVKALAAIENLAKKQPDKPYAAHLKGQVKLAQGDRAAARAGFEAALKIDPNYYPSIASLAGLDMAEKGPDAAKKRLTEVTEKNPKNARAWLGLADVAIREGAKLEDVTSLVDKAVNATPQDPVARAYLVEYHLRARRFKEAVDAATKATSAIADNPTLLDYLGRAQQAAGDSNQAITTFSKLAALRPSAPQPYFRLAGAQVAAKDKPAAAENLKKALAIKPDYLEAQLASVALDSDAGRFAQALAQAKLVQKQRPKESIGYMLEGDVMAWQKNWDAALAAYQTGLKAAPNTEIAIKTQTVYTLSGKKEQAAAFVESWQKSHPKDAGFLLYQADAALSRNEYENAEKYYGALTKLQPNNALALNNFAWVTAKLKKSGALEMSQRANELVPNQPEFMDTLAVLLSDSGEHAKAIDTATKALSLRQDNPQIKLNLAKIYLKAGDKKMARKQLEDLQRLGDKFPNQAEVATLLATT